MQKGEHQLIIKGVKSPTTQTASNIFITITQFLQANKRQVIGFGKVIDKLPSSSPVFALFIENIFYSS